jgi:AraC-like DNA-binding protein
MPAYLESVLQFDFGDLPIVRSVTGGIERARPLGLVGPHITSGTTVTFEGAIDSFAIFLHPAALWSLFRTPVSVVMETHYDAADVLGADFTRLWNRLAEADSFPGRVRIAERFLLQKWLPDMSDTLGIAAARMLAGHGGKIVISDLAARVNISERQLERVFFREIGATPKQFARVARFQAALDARVRDPGRSWLDISQTAGFHDQMHMVHDFKAFGGLPPTLTLERLGDSRPSALAQSTGSRAEP